MKIGFCKNCKYWRYSQIENERVMGDCSSEEYYEEKLLELGRKPDSQEFPDPQGILIQMQTPGNHSCSYFDLFS